MPINGSSTETLVPEEEGEGTVYETYDSNKRLTRATRDDLRKMLRLVLFLRFVLEIEMFDDNDIFVNAHDLINNSEYQRSNTLVVYLPDNKVLSILEEYRKQNPLYVKRYEAGGGRVHIPRFLAYLQTAAIARYGPNLSVECRGWFIYYLRPDDELEFYYYDVPPDNRTYYRLHGHARLPTWSLYSSLIDGGYTNFVPNKKIRVSRKRLPASRSKVLMRLERMSILNLGVGDTNRTLDKSNGLSWYVIDDPGENSNFQLVFILKRLRSNFIRAVYRKLALEDRYPNSQGCTMLFESQFMLYLKKYNLDMVFIHDSDDTTNVLDHNPDNMYLIGINEPTDWYIGETKIVEMNDFCDNRRP